MDKYIAILEDCPERVERMSECIKKSSIPFKVVLFSNAFLMIEWLIQNKSNVVLISLDHDLDLIVKNGESHDPGTGKDVTNYLFSHEPFCPVIIHTSNYFGRESMKYRLLDKEWAVSIVMPSPEMSWIDSDWLPCVCSLIENRKI
jgi:hypothetical protein